MRVRGLAWAAAGLLIVVVALFALFVRPPYSDKVEPSPTVSRPAGPVLATIDSSLSTQAEIRPATPESVSLSTAESVTEQQLPNPSEAEQMENLQPAVTESQLRLSPASTPTERPPSPASPPAAADPTDIVATATLPGPTPSPASSPATSATLTPAPAVSPTSTPIGAATLLPTATPTSRPAESPTPTTPGISGRVLLNGQPVEADLVLVLEDQAFNQIAETRVMAGGMYQFLEMPPSDTGYNVTFSWERNQSYGLDEVVAWGWIGPVAYDGQSALRLPDLEIALLGLEQIQPEPDTRQPAASISAATPLSFAWGTHPAATRYWVDILADTLFERIWHSAFTQATSARFDGQLEDGSRIQPGAYWWAVGGQSTRDGYQLTIYGHLSAFRLTS